MRRIKKHLRRITIGIMCLCVLAGMLAGKSPIISEAKSETELNIYAVYLDSAQKGESVILESRGEILVMDLGVADCTRAVVKQLQKLDASHISIYFSHLHKDHIGGSDESMLDGLNMIVNAGFTIDKLYLPDPSLASESIAYPLKYQKIQEFIAQQGSRIEYLKLDSEFEVGDAYGYVIGPVHPELFHPQDYENEEYDPDGDSLSPSFTSYTYYENNCSLITQVVCNNTVYLATGDALKDEVSQTVAMYGGVEGLKVDILKLSHHGTASGNVGSLLASTDAPYIFAQNTAYTGMKNGKWYCYGSYKNAVKHGMPYYVANEKKTLIYHVADDVVTMYEESIAPENQITGWKRLTGGDGVIRDYNYYYIDENGKITTGVKQLDGKYYHFSKAGCLQYGDYSEAGGYLGWKTYEDGRRYYAMEADGRTYMCRGISLLPTDGKYHYFNSSGYIMEGTGALVTKQIGKYTYGFDGYGAMLQDTMQLMSNGGLSYFDTNGHMAVKAIIPYNGKRYYFGSNGTMVKDQLVDYEGDTYYLTEDGSMLCGQLYELNGKTHYFKNDGRMAKQEFTTINGKEYYYGKAGTLVTDQIVKLAGKSYYVDENGCKVSSTLKDVGNKTYYFGEAGEMAKKEFVELNGNTCYFGKYGTQVKNQMVKVSGSNYYLNQNGYLMKKAQVVLNSKIYYFDNEGKMVTKTLITIAGHKYYFGKAGTMVTNKKVRINGKAYYFNKNGIMETKKYVKVGKRWYYCDETGKMLPADDYAGA